MMNQKEKLYPIPAPLPFQTPAEEIANAVLHGIGALLASAGLVLFCVAGGGALAVTSHIIFAVSMIAMFLASTLYHAIQAEAAKRIFRIIDHSAIYLLIAGTYTPYSLLGFRGALGWTYFGVEWGLAAVGITLYAANVKFIKRIELVVYILMGWACVFGMVRLVRSMSQASTLFLILGGAAYTLGTIWYSRRTRRNSHVIWHAFVLAGAVLHWWSIWFLK
jgi:hemolysin III